MKRMPLLASALDYIRMKAQRRKRVTPSGEAVKRLKAANRRFAR